LVEIAEVNPEGSPWMSRRWWKGPMMPGYVEIWDREQDPDAWG
jgi:hypothetical protein